MSRSAYDLIAEYYDFDMGMNAPKNDVEFYVNWAAGRFGPVLELGCGTGRITLPMVQAGCTVLGIDLSIPMLRQLKTKAEFILSSEELSRLSLCCMDMRQLALDASFSLIICPYSAACRASSRR